MLRIVVSGLVALACALSVEAAQVFRCVDAQGRVEYGDVPCNGQSGGPITISPNVISGMDQAQVRALSRAIDQSVAARIASESQARAPRAPNVAIPPVQATPWWQQPGPPPDRQPPAPAAADSTPAPSPPPAPVVAPAPRPLAR